MIVFAKIKDVHKTPEINIGIVGHVDHGKTTLTQALTGKWTDVHSEELKRGITIRLGYADAVFYYCKKCDRYCNTKKCPKCFGDCEPTRSVSFIDAPGHETLMATVLSGAALMDGALLLIAADEPVPQPQTAEHLKALDIVGIKNIVVVQNKIDVVTEQQAMENYKQIKSFLKGTIAENAPIIPTSAVHNANIDLVIKAIEENIPTPKRDLKKPPKFYIARSFDVNKPGTEINNIKGGVVGGSLVQGFLEIGDKIEIKPGLNKNGEWKTIKTTIKGIVQSRKAEKAVPGGLVAIETGLDPSITKSDALSGSVLGIEGKLPDILYNIKIDTKLFDHVIGVKGHIKLDKIPTGTPLMITATIAKSVGIVTSAQDKPDGQILEIKLKIPICSEKKDKVAISMQIEGRWHLVGWGEIL